MRSIYEVAVFSTTIILCILIAGCSGKIITQNPELSTARDSESSTKAINASIKQAEENTILFSQGNSYNLERLLTFVDRTNQNINDKVKIEIMTGSSERSKKLARTLEFKDQKIVYTNEEGTTFICNNIEIQKAGNEARFEANECEDNVPYEWVYQSSLSDLKAAQQKQDLSN